MILIFKLLEGLLSAYWWQIPLAAVLITGVLTWDHKRISRKVEAAKIEVSQKIEKANDKTVETADRIRKRVSDAPLSKPSRLRRDGGPDPHSTD